LDDISLFALSLLSPLVFQLLLLSKLNIALFLLDPLVAFTSGEFFENNLSKRLNAKITCGAERSQVHFLVLPSLLAASRQKIIKNITIFFIIYQPVSL
jgi:hypothetical protein